MRAHLGITKILEEVRSRFYWPGHKPDVELFVASCCVSQKNHSLEETYPKSTSIEDQFSSFLVGIEFMGSLLFSAGSRQVLLISDLFSKRQETVSLPDQLGPTKGKAPVDHGINRFECAESLHSDRGRIFESTLFTSLSKILQKDKTRKTV